MDERTCKACGKAMVQRSKEAAATFRLRKFCNYQCSVDFSRRSMLITKPCVTCGVSMSRSDGQTASDWKRQNNCSTACIREYQAKRQRDIRHRAVLPAKQCVVCGVWFDRHDNESIPSFKVKKACSQRCAAELLKGYRKDWPDKICESCGATFSRKPGERAGNWSRKLTCSIRCAAALLVKTRSGQRERVHAYPEGWTRNEGKLLKAWIRERDGHRCFICGQTESRRLLPVHHIDYIKANIDPSNLITLCDPCHAKTNAERDYWQAYFTTIMAQREDVEIAA